VLPIWILDLANGVALRKTADTNVREYVALSYCWGQDQTVKTTRNTLPAHLMSIDKAQLPRTIQDAITVCRNLDFRYLWVDSLCIVQDGPDVHREVANMAHYYGGASLTIAAASAANCSEGFSRQQHWGF
jgi:hypothetical protein